MSDKNLLSEELETYEKNKIRLLKESFGKFVLIKDKEIIDVFDTQADAIKFGIEKFGNVPFFVRKIEEVESRQNFTSHLINFKKPCLQ